MSLLNSAKVASTTEVAVSPPSVFLADVKAKLRKDFNVSAQV